MTFSKPRHRLLLALALRGGGPVKLRELAGAAGRVNSVVHHHLQRLRQAGLVENTPAGYRLRPHVVVSEGGFVGRVVPLETGRG